MGAHKINNLHIGDVTALRVAAFKGRRFDLLKLSPKQGEAMAILTDETTEELLFGGAAGGGKSWLGCEWLLWSCLAYAGTSWFIGRKVKEDIRQSTYDTFVKVCKKWSIPSSYYKYNEQKGIIKFYNGSKITFIELKYYPSDPDYTGFGSKEYTGGWIEEAGDVVEKAYTIASTRIGRHLNDEYSIKGKLLITANPAKNWLYKLFYKPKASGVLEKAKAFIQSLVTDNNYSESGYMLRLDKLKGVDRARLRLGDWDYSNSDLDLMTYDAICDTWTNSHVKPTGKKYITADIALKGADKLRIGVWDGWVLIDKISIPKSDGKEVVDALIKMKNKHGVPNSNIVYDNDGVGGFLGGWVKNGIPFINNSRPLQDENYANLKAQCYYHLAEKINEAEVYLKAIVDVEDREMVEMELLQVKRRDADKDGKLKIIRKEQVKQNLGYSPDWSDMLMMRSWFDKRPVAQSRRIKKIRQYKEY